MTDDAEPERWLWDDDAQLYRGPRGGWMSVLTVGLVGLGDIFEENVAALGGTP